MIHEPDRTRRRALKTIFWGLSGLVSIPFITGRPRRAAASVIRPYAQRIFTHRRSVEAVGRAYLRTRPGDDDPERLLDAVSRRLDRSVLELACMKKGECLERIDAAVRADFAHGRTVKVEGWILSETEARLCALGFLTLSG